MSLHNQYVLEDLHAILAEPSFISNVMGGVPRVTYAAVKTEMIFSVKAVSLEVGMEGFKLKSVILIDKNNAGARMPLQAMISIHKVKSKGVDGWTNIPIMNRAHAFKGLDTVPLDFRKAVDALSHIGFMLKNDYAPWDEHGPGFAWSVSDCISEEDISKESTILDNAIGARRKRFKEVSEGKTFKNEDDSLVIVRPECMVRLAPCAAITLGVDGHPFRVSKYFELTHAGGKSYFRQYPNGTTRTVFESFINRILG